MRYLIQLISILLIINSQLMAQSPEATEYVPHVVVLKIDESTAAKGERRLSAQVLRGMTHVNTLQAIKPISRFSSKTGQQKPSILDGIYKVKLASSQDEMAFIRSLNKYANLKYAERYPVVKPLEVPNDPNARLNGPQYYLQNILAYDAWNSTRGNSDIIIAIVDTGVDLDHEDLQANLYLNEDDPIDGIDNDGDGYVDNYYGWDIADNDNLPEADFDEHGTYVAGVAAAATNNALGIAGVGYNTKFMPIKIFQSENNFSFNSYDGIIYAADQGCDIINLSWGGVSRYNQYAQDIINYAVLEKNAVVVAAAGNTNANLDFYPASYENVISVGYVDNLDQKAGSATYSNFIDMVAPGNNINTTFNNDSYGNETGSSLAAPMVAGAAALIKSFYPNYSAVEIAEQLRVNTDNIYNISANSPYVNLLGKGRLNVFKAVNNDDEPSVRVLNFSYSNGFGQEAYYGDTLAISPQLKAFLADVRNLNIMLEVESPYVSMIDSSYFVGDILKNTTVQLNEIFKFRLSEDMPEGEKIYLRFKFIGDFYNDYQSVFIESSPESQLIEFGNWKFNYSSSANFGYNSTEYFRAQALNYNGNNLLRHQGVILSASVDSISSNVAIEPIYNNYRDDFEVITELKRFRDITAGLDLRSEFTEKNSVINSLGITVGQRLLAWDESGHQNYLIQEYELQNRSSRNYDSLFFSFFSDWAIGDFSANSVAFDNESGIAYATDQTNSIFVGIAFLANADTIFNALNIESYNGHASDLINDSLKSNLIWENQANSFTKLQAGELSGGNNVGSIYGALIKGFDTLESVNLRTAIMVDGSIEGLRTTLDSARKRQQRIDELLVFGEELYTCESGAISFSAPEDSIYVYEQPTDQVPAFKGVIYELENISSDTTLYYESLDNRGFKDLRKRLLIKVLKPEANFSLEETPYLLEPNETNLLIFKDESIGGNDRRWFFENGYSSTMEIANVPFNSEGSYDVTLVSINEIGCSDTLTRTIQTAFRSPSPQIEDISICESQVIVLNDPSIAEIHVYADSSATELLFQGASFEISGLESDTVFYIRNEEGAYPSLMNKVEISLNEVRAGFKVFTDLQSNSEEIRAYAVNESLATGHEWFLKGESLGSLDSVYFSLRDFESGDLVLVASNDYGCRDSLYFTGQKSLNPTFGDLKVCQGEMLNIVALNTEKMYFYADEEMTVFLGKGNRLNISNVDDQTMVYAVNVDQIIASETVSVPIIVSSLKASFSISNDTINLAFDEEVFAEATDSTATSWSWNLGNGQSKSSKRILLNYDNPGIYRITLNVGDSLSCTAYDEKNMVVINDPILGTKSQLNEYFTLFPNPASQFLNLEGKDDFSFDEYTIIDSQGREWINYKNEKPSVGAQVINIQQLPDGIFRLIIKKGANKASFVFMVKR